MIKRIIYQCSFIILYFLIVLINTSCITTIEEQLFSDEETLTLATFIEENKENHGLFWKIIESGDLIHTMSCYNPHGNGYTLFLPTDDAILNYIGKSSKYSSFEELLEDRTFVAAVGRYHLVNSKLRSSEFSYGALSDTTVSGDLLTMAFVPVADSIVYKVNNTATITQSDIEMVNGYIHIVSELLEPVIFSSMDWLLNDDEDSFSILTDAFIYTGLQEQMGIYKFNSDSSKLVLNTYTVLAEPDTLFHRYGIFSFNDLVQTLEPEDLEFENPNNAIYQFAAYHIIEGSFFLDDLTGESSNYNTFASYPVSINAEGIDIQVNIGVDTFAYLISGMDTSVVNYLGLHIQQSNNLSKNGAIHLLTEILKPFKPNRSVRTFQFYNEEQITISSRQYGSYEFLDSEDFAVINWTGPDKIEYIKSQSSDERAYNKDYILIEGRFSIEYEIPKILPGKYLVKIRTNAVKSGNATIQVYLDDRRKGGNFDLTKGGNSNNPYYDFVLGEVDYSKYTDHKIRIETLIPGEMIWDYVRFEPVK